MFAEGVQSGLLQTQFPRGFLTHYRLVVMKEKRDLYADFALPDRPAGCLETGAYLALWQAIQHLSDLVSQSRFSAIWQAIAATVVARFNCSSVTLSRVSWAVRRCRTLLFGSLNPATRRNAGIPEMAKL